MTIHYRILDAHNTASNKIYRSIERARKDLAEGETLVAWSSRAHAVALAPERIDLKDYPRRTPRILSAEMIREYLDDCETARALNPKYPPSNASGRRRLEEKYEAELFGFDPLGRAVWSYQSMSVSCKWIRFSAPVYINDRKSNATGLRKAL